MSFEQMVAIMAAIIYAGADDAEKSAGYSPKVAVERALTLMAEVQSQIPEFAKDKTTEGRE